MIGETGERKSAVATPDGKSRMKKKKYCIVLYSYETLGLCNHRPTPDFHSCIHRVPVQHAPSGNSPTYINRAPTLDTEDASRSSGNSGCANKAPVVRKRDILMSE